MHTTRMTHRFLGSAAVGLALAIAATPAALAQRAGAGAEKPAAKAGAREKNAALEYVTIQEQLDKEFSSLAGEEYGKFIEPGWAPSEKLCIMLEDNQRLIKRLMDATKLPVYDMQLRYEEGFSLLVSHLGPMRQFARILAVDARRLALSGRPDEAVERLTTCLRMAKHASEDRILISSLVGIAITALANRQIETLAAEGHLTEAGRREYIRQAKIMLTDDPFGTKACLAMERTLAVNTIRPIIEGKGATAGKELAAHLRKLQMSVDDVADIAVMNEDQVNEQLDLMDRYYAALTAAWGQKEAQTRLGELEGRLERGDFGVLMKEIGPALSKAHSSVEKVMKEIKDVIALLEASGAPAPEIEAEQEEAGE